jgi:uncharacterized protein (TIGR02001 family)
MKFVPAQIALAAALSLSTAVVLAQTAAPAAPAPAAASPMSFNLSLASNYKFRGQDQAQNKTTAFKPALQGGVDYAFDSGFYLGNWNSTVNWLADNKLEIDVYGGYKFKAGALDLDVGALAYRYPGAAMANTTEAYLGATYGPVTAKYSRTISDGYFGILDAKGTGYFSLAFAQEVAPKTTFKASVAKTVYASSVTAADYVDYSIGGAYDLGDGLSASAAFVGANKKSSYTFVVDGTKSINKNTLVLMLTKAL